MLYNHGATSVVWQAGGAAQPQRRRGVVRVGRALCHRTTSTTDEGGVTCFTTTARRRWCVRPGALHSHNGGGVLSA